MPCDPWEPPAEGRLELTARVDHARIDRKARGLGRKPLLRVAEASLVPRPVHEISRILAVVDGELRIEAKPDRIFAQEPRAEAMERSSIGWRRRGGGFRRETAGEQAFDAPTKLSRRAA